VGQEFVSAVVMDNRLGDDGAQATYASPAKAAYARHGEEDQHCRRVWPIATPGLFLYCSRPVPGYLPAEMTGFTGSLARMMRKIIHIDMDAFYASVEQRDNPSLRGRPVAVGHAAKRGVVAAASYEARKFGVRSAMPSTTAARKCPELVFMPPRFEVYRAISQQIRVIFADYTPLIEPLSLDEAYLDVTENLRGLATATETAAQIRARIFQETSLTASAGISYNKFLAKLGSEQRKPDGQFVIPPDRGAAFVERLAVSKFHGVGPVTAEKMNRLGIQTGADLRAHSLEFLYQNFGKSGSWYFAIARGEDDRPVRPDRKSSGSETTFQDDLTDLTAVEAGVLGQANEVWAWCQKANAYGRTVTVKIKYADFQIATRSRSVASVIASQAELHILSLELIRAVYPLRDGIRLVGVSISNFDRKEAVDHDSSSGLLFANTRTSSPSPA
jgi:DNA polymerase-4